MTGVGRNEPCPCGSGKRYKECHGTIGVAGGSDAGAFPASGNLSSVRQAIQVALRARESGRRREAAAIYRQLLETEPSNVDVLQRLALVEYEQGRYESAVALLKRVIELRPELPIPRENLRMLQSMPGIEDGICREVLPRLAARVVLVSDPSRFAPSANGVHLVLIDDDSAGQPDLINRLRRAFAPRLLELWVQAGSAFTPPDARTVMADAGVHPTDGLIVLLGASRSCAGWLGATRAERVLLIVVREEPCALIDRIDEVSLLCDARPGLVCASHSLAERLGLPTQAAFADAIAVERR